MKKLIIGLLACLAVAVAAVPVASADNWSESKLDTAATTIAGHPTQVWCEDSWSAWIHLGDSVEQNWDGLYGFTFMDDPVVYINPDQCLQLHLLLAGGDVGTANASMALLTLAHEASHQAGYADEGDAECHALPLLDDLAVGYFGVPATASVPYTASVKKKVGVRVNGHTVVRTVTTKTVKYKRVRNPWLTRLERDAQIWHDIAPAEYRTKC
jgi:hypothetical protein